MAHPYKSEHESGLKAKVRKMADGESEHESPYKKAERIAKCGIDHIPMAPPEDE